MEIRDYLLIFVPVIFIVDLLMTLAVMLQKVEGRNLVPILRFIMLGVGAGASWHLLLGFPSLGSIYDYFYGGILIYFIFLRILIFRS